MVEEMESLAGLLGSEGFEAVIRAWRLVARASSNSGPSWMDRMVG